MFVLLLCFLLFLLALRSIGELRSNGKTETREALGEKVAFIRILGLCLNLTD